MSPASTQHAAWPRPKYRLPAGVLQDFGAYMGGTKKDLLLGRPILLLNRTALAGTIYEGVRNPWGLPEEVTAEIFQVLKEMNSRVPLAPTSALLTAQE